MITDTLKEIESTKSKLAELQKKAENERSKQLNNLHSNLGFASREELIAALRSIDGSKPKAARGRKPKAAAAPKSAKKRGKRARITDEVRQQVIAALKSGEKGTKVAKDYGISLPSLQNIKKAAGMTKARK